MKSTTTCNRLCGFVLLADVREHHCSLDGKLNWFSLELHRKYSINLITHRELSFQIPELLLNC